MYNDSSIVKSKNKQIKVIVAKSIECVQPKLAVFLFGANHTLTNLCMLPTPTLLLPEDFKSSITFDVSYKNMLSGNLPKKFVFKHMLPNVFRQLRSKFQIDEDFFISSFKGEPKTIQCKNMNHYESANGFLIFKVIESEYAEGLLNLMPSYFKYLSERKFNSLLPQYCAIFKITIENKRYNLIVMRNTTGGLYKIEEWFKIKYFSEKDVLKESDTLDDKKKKKVDSETIKNTSSKFCLNIEDEIKKEIIEKAQNDAKFLCENSVYGWSFLVTKSDPIPIIKNHETTVLKASPPKPKRMSCGSPIEKYGDSQLIENSIIDNAKLTILNNSYIYHLGCLDVSSFCKHVKKSFSEKPRKKTHSKSIENEPSVINSHKNKHKTIDPEMLVQMINDLLSNKLYNQNASFHSKTL